MFWKFLIDFDTPNRKYDCDIYLVRKIDVLAKRCGTAPVFMDAKMGELHDLAMNSLVLYNSYDRRFVLPQICFCDQPVLSSKNKLPCLYTSV